MTITHTEYSEAGASYVGKRRSIRSAGRTSGSIELTLPGTFRAFLGADCDITVHGGTSPFLMVQPDVAKVRDRVVTLHTAAAGAFKIAAPQSPLVIFAIGEAERDDLQATDNLQADETACALRVALGDCSYLMTLDRCDSCELHRGLGVLESILVHHLGHAAPALAHDGKTSVARCLAATACQDRSRLTLFESDGLTDALHGAHMDRTMLEGDLFSRSFWAELQSVANILISRLASDGDASAATKNAASQFANAQRAWARAGRIASMADM
ncbi:MAG: hypothetical protein AAF141_05795 [Pseudomonadota bacterium]